MIERMAEQFDVDATRDAFLDAIKADIQLGEWFTTSQRYKWKYIASKDNAFVARHGEFIAVVTLTHLEGTNVIVYFELKVTPLE